MFLFSYQNLLKFQGQLNKARKPNFLIVDKNTSIAEIEDAFRSFCGRKDLYLLTKLAKLILFRWWHCDNTHKSTCGRNDSLPSGSARGQHSNSTRNTLKGNALWRVKGQHIEPGSWFNQSRRYEIIWTRPMTFYHSMFHSLIPPICDEQHT